MKKLTWIEWTGRLFITRRLTTLTIITLLTIFFGWQAQYLTMKTPTIDLFPQNHEYVKTYVEYENTFGGANVCLIALVTKEGDVFNAQTLKKVIDVTNALKYIPSVDNYQILSLSQQKVKKTRMEIDEFGTPKLFPYAIMQGPEEREGSTGEEEGKISLEPEDIERIRQDVYTTGRLHGSLISKNDKAALIVASFREIGMVNQTDTLRQIMINDAKQQVGGEEEKPKEEAAAPAEGENPAGEEEAIAALEAKIKELQLPFTLDDTLYGAIEKIAKSVEDDNTSTHMIGRPVLLGQIQKDFHQLYFIFMLTILTTIIVLFLYFRDLRGVMIPMATMVISAIWGLGMMSMIGRFNHYLAENAETLPNWLAQIAATIKGWGLEGIGHFNPLVIVVPFIISARALSHSVQLIERFIEEFRERGDKYAAAEATYNGLFKPAILSLLVDAAGIFIVILTPIPLMKGLALMSAFWVMSIVVSNQIFNPVILSLLPAPKIPSIFLDLKGLTEQSEVDTKNGKEFRLPEGATKEEYEAFLAQRPKIMAKNKADLLALQNGDFSVLPKLRQRVLEMKEEAAKVKLPNIVAICEEIILLLDGSHITPHVIEGLLDVHIWTHHALQSYAQYRETPVSVSDVRGFLAKLQKTYQLSFQDRLLNRMGQLVQSKAGKWILTGAVVVFVVAFYFARNIVIGDVHPGSPMLRPNSQYNKDTTVIGDMFGNTEKLSIVLEGKTHKAVKDPRVLRIVEGLQRHLEAIEEVHSTESIADLLTTTTSVYYSDNPKWDLIPETAKEAGQYLELLFSGVEPGDLDRFVTRNFKDGNVGVNLRDHKGETLRAVVAVAKDYIANNPLVFDATKEEIDEAIKAANQDVIQALDREIAWFLDKEERRSLALGKQEIERLPMDIVEMNLEKISDDAKEAMQRYKRTIYLAEQGKLEVAKFRLAGGYGGLLAAINEAIVRAEAKVTILAFLIVFLMCVLAFRSILAGFLFLIPTAISNYMTYSLMGALQIGMDVNTLPVVALGVGLGVDYGLYVVSRLEEEYVVSGDWGMATARSITTAGKAVLFTATTMVAGIIFWMFSFLRFQAEMGMLLAFWMVISMIGGLILLPTIVFLIKPRFVRIKRQV